MEFNSQASSSNSETTTTTTATTITTVDLSKGNKAVILQRFLNSWRRVRYATKCIGLPEMYKWKDPAALFENYVIPFCTRFKEIDRHEHLEKYFTKRGIPSVIRDALQSFFCCHTIKKSHVKNPDDPTDLDISLQSDDKYCRVHLGKERVRLTHVVIYVKNGHVVSGDEHASHCCHTPECYYLTHVVAENKRVNWVERGWCGVWRITWVKRYGLLIIEFVYTCHADDFCFLPSQKHLDLRIKFEIAAEVPTSLGRRVWFCTTSDVGAKVMEGTAGLRRYSFLVVGEKGDKSTVTMGMSADVLDASTMKGVLTGIDTDTEELSSISSLVENDLRAEKATDLETLKLMSINPPKKAILPLTQKQQGKRSMTKFSQMMNLSQEDISPPSSPKTDTSFI